MSRRAVIWGYALLALFTVLPLLSLLLAGFLGDIGGCVVHEGFPQRCMIKGQDWGEVLYRMHMVGWLLVVTVPVGFAGLLLWTMVAIIAWLRRRSTGRKPS